MYALKNDQTTMGSCTPESFDNTSIVECQSFVYDTSLFSETLATKLDLVCKLYVNYLNSKNCIIKKNSLTKVPILFSNYIKNLFLSTNLSINCLV